MKYTVLVKPGSAKESVEKQPDGSLIIRTRKKAHDGEANVAVIESLSEYFHTAKTNIMILKGQTSRHKVVEII